MESFQNKRSHFKISSDESRSGFEIFSDDSRVTSKYFGVTLESLQYGSRLKMLQRSWSTGTRVYRRVGLYSARPAWKATGTSGQRRSSDDLQRPRHWGCCLTGSPHQWGRVEAGQSARGVNATRWLGDSYVYEGVTRALGSGPWQPREKQRDKGRSWRLTTKQQHYVAYHPGAVFDEVYFSATRTTIT